MPEDQTTDELDTATDEVDTGETTDETVDAGADQLGDAGKKALDRMKTQRAELKKELAAYKGLGLSADDLKALIDKSQDESAKAEAAKVRQEAEGAALAKANERLVKAEIRAAATGKLANPALALQLLDVKAFDVNDDGEVDSDAITAALDDLIKNEPYLSAQGGKRFQGTGDGGPRKAAPSQLTREDLKGMTPDQILKAKTDGRMKTLLGT